MSKPITITIAKKDWHKGISYGDPCRCLLHNAVKRRFPSKAVEVFYGRVRLWPKAPTAPMMRYIYSKRKYERRLRAAHSNPKLLPMEIVLK